jgi:hypothetical protein
MAPLPISPRRQLNLIMDPLRAILCGRWLDYETACGNDPS